MKEFCNDLTVLVVEDEWLVRDDIAGRFRQDGWTVLEAATGDDALKWLRETQTIHLLVTDISLADAMTGWDVAEAVRKVHAQIAVVYATGGANDENRRVPESIFLSKPVAVQELIITCDRLLSARR
ncbi:MAG TPA: response regulator [Roseiarcus sp.]